MITPTSMLHVLCLFTRPEKRQPQQGLLSLLVLWFSFPAGASQIPYFLILPWQPNKMATGHKRYTGTLGRQTSNDHNCQI